MNVQYIELMVAADLGHFYRKRKGVIGILEQVVIIDDHRMEMQPGRVRWQTERTFVADEMNLMSAIGRGLGLRPDADLTRVAIIRGSLTDPKVAVVNAQAVMQGKAPNFRLEPGDIIHVPGSGGHSLKDYAREAVNTFVRVVAANEGGNAGALNSQNVGVNVNIGGTN